MNRFYISKKSKKVFQVSQNEDGTLSFYPNEMNFRLLIHQAGGVEQFLTKCQESELSYDEFSAQYRAQLKKAREAQGNKDAERYEREYNESAAEYATLVDQYNGKPIDCTAENLRVVMRYLNARNWGSWELPAMTQSYTANQYDCGGLVTCTAIKLDEGIVVDGVLYKLLKIGGKNATIIKKKVHNELGLTITGDAYEDINKLAYIAKNGRE